MNSPSLNSKYSKTMPREYFGDYEGLYLKHIYERVGENCPEAIDIACEFMAKTTRGFGHNRFRSKMSRQFKHVHLTEQQKESILETILNRFVEGDIDEQFIEQLRFARWLDKNKTINVAKELLGSDKDYIVKYANKVLALGDSPVE